MAQDVSDVIQAKIKSGTLPASHDGSGKSYAGKGTDKPWPDLSAHFCTGK